MLPTKLSNSENNQNTVFTLTNPSRLDKVAQTYSRKDPWFYIHRFIFICVFQLMP